MTAVRRSAAAGPQRGPDAASLDRVFDPGNPRERILAAAITTVAERGFGGLTVKEVAHQAGIKAPGLYSHFPSREAILTEAVSRVLTDFMDAMHAVAEDDPEAELRESIRRHVLYQIENLQIARVADLVLNTATAGHFLSSEDYESLVSLQRSHITLLCARVTAFAPRLTPAEANVASLAIIAMCDRVANWFEADGEYDAGQLADLHWRLARAMLA